MGLFGPFLIDLLDSKHLKCVGFVFILIPNRHPNASGRKLGQPDFAIVRSSRDSLILSHFLTSIVLSSLESPVWNRPSG